MIGVRRKEEFARGHFSSSFWTFQYLVVKATGDSFQKGSEQMTACLYVEHGRVLAATLIRND